MTLKIEPQKWYVDAIGEKWFTIGYSACKNRLVAQSDCGRWWFSFTLDGRCLDNRLWSLVAEHKPDTTPIIRFAVISPDGAVVSLVKDQGDADLICARSGSGYRVAELREVEK